jgi:hypothetical protein
MPDTQRLPTRDARKFSAKIGRLKVPESFAALAEPNCRYEETLSLLQYWEGRLQHTSLEQDTLTAPELDPLDIPHLLPYIYLLEWKGDRLVYRIAGENVNGLFSRQLTGRYFDEVVPKEPYKVVFPYFKAVFDMKATLFKGRIILRGREFMDFERLMLPVTRSSKVMLLGCAAFSTTASVRSNPLPESEPGFHFQSLDLKTGEVTTKSVDMTPVFA